MRENEPEQYKHAKKVWETFKIKNMGVYRDFSLKQM